MLTVLALAALASECARAIMTGSARRLLSPMLVPAALALLLTGAQLLRWPAGVLSILDPAAVRLHAMIDGVSGVEGAPALRPSLYPHATRQALMLLSAYISLFLATSSYVRSRRQVGVLAGPIVAVGFAVSLLGILQNLSGTDRIYWWRELRHGGALFGSFVSRNQFATYAGICAFLAVGLLLARSARAAGSFTLLRESAGRRKTAMSRPDLLIGFAAAVMAVAVIWSMSRAGIVSMALSFAVVLVALGSTGSRRGRGLHVAAIVVVVIGATTYLGWQRVADKLSTLPQASRGVSGRMRMTMFRDAVDMGTQFPSVGHGRWDFHVGLPPFPHLAGQCHCAQPAQ